MGPADVDLQVLVSRSGTRCIRTGAAFQTSEVDGLELRVGLDDKQRLDQFGDSELPCNCVDAIDVDEILVVAAICIPTDVGENSVLGFGFDVGNVEHGFHVDHIISQNDRLGVRGRMPQSPL